MSEPSDAERSAGGPAAGEAVTSPSYEVRVPSRVRVEPHAVVFEDWGLQRFSVLCLGMATGTLIARYILLFGAERVGSSDAMFVFASSLGLAALAVLVMTAIAAFVASRMKVAKVTFTAHGFQKDGDSTSYESLRSWSFEGDRLVLVASDGKTLRTPRLAKAERDALEGLLASRAEPEARDVPDALDRLRAQASSERQGPSRT